MVHTRLRYIEVKVCKTVNPACSRQHSHPENLLFFTSSTSVVMSTLEEPPVVNGPTAEVKAEEEQKDPADLEREFQEKSKQYLVEQTSHVIIPLFAQWFDINKVHSIEEKLFPDFFLENAVKLPHKTRDVYVNMRDFIINVYRLNPKEYLSITAVRRNLAGDVTTIIRVHQFLEKWGLINYQIDPRTKPLVVGPQYTGHFQITMDTPTGLVPMIPGGDSNKRDKAASKPVKHQPLNVEVRKNIYTTDSRKQFAPNTVVQYFCNMCGKDTTEVRYHNLKIKTYSHNPSLTVNNTLVLCTVCFDQGLFPQNFQTLDFVQLKKNQEAGDWTEHEVLLLLEGIDMFATFDAPPVNGNVPGSITNHTQQWEKIAEHVGTKSREQCVLKFIQLPIEDKYLNKLVHEDEETLSPQTPQVDETVIQKVVRLLLESNEGKSMLKENSEQLKKNAEDDQLQLVQQIAELMVEKVDLKLQKIDALQLLVMRVENQLNMERKQVLIERWAQFEKVEKLKQQRPDLALVLDDLMAPVKITEINKALHPVRLDDVLESAMDLDATPDEEKEKLPVSVVSPKTYQYWSG